MNSYQSEIVNKCLEKRQCALSAPLGSGKTLMSLNMALFISEPGIKPAIVVCAKNLIAGWITEIRKWYRDDYPFQVLHGTNVSSFKLNKDTILVITTPNMISRTFTKAGLEERCYFMTQRPQDIAEVEARENRWGPPAPMVKYYPHIDAPYLVSAGTPADKGPNIIFSIEWSCIIIDEMQLYTNVNTKTCMGLMSVYASRRWGLSGTLFTEPKIDRILGFLLILDQLPDNLRSIPDLEDMVYRGYYGWRGLSSFVVEMEKRSFLTDDTPDLKCHHHIVGHTISQTEALVYTSFKKIISNVHRRVKELRNGNDIDGSRRFASYLMASLTYMRQLLVCPIVPITSVAVDAFDVGRNTELSKIIMSEIQELEGIQEYLDDTDSLVSSRFRKAYDIISNIPNDERTVMFFSFRTCLDVFVACAETDRPIYVLRASHSASKRGSIIAEFGESRNGILCLTYGMGAEGLNLQCASHIILMSFWWNVGKTTQAIGRLWRQGQTRDVHVYIMTSNTGIERAMLEKQMSKQEICDKIMTRTLSKEDQISTMSMNDIVEILEHERDNMELCTGVYKEI